MRIDAGSYTVSIERDGLSGLEQFLAGAGKSRKLFLLTDTNVYRHCFPELCRLAPVMATVPVHVMPAGEAAKNMDTVMEICRFLAGNKAGRSALLINLGGGVVTDTGGFAASVYKRGIGFIHLPTTLLGQIDASVGGKTGIDAFGLKNILGTFSMPEAVMIFPGFLATLDGRQLRSGLAEALKHALIADRNYWSSVRDFDFLQYGDLITRSVEIKNAIVQSDPQEAGARRKLNFGHTIGHAIESYFVNRGSEAVTHGEAVAAGMICEAYLSRGILGFPEEDLRETEETIRRFFAPVQLPRSAVSELLDYMRNDKKNTSGISFTLLNRIGESSAGCEVAEDRIEASVAYYISGK